MPIMLGSQRNKMAQGHSALGNVFPFTAYCQIAFQSGCSKLNSHLQSVSALIASYSHRHLVLPAFLIFVNHGGNKMVSHCSCMSMITSDTEYLFMCKHISVPSPKAHLFISFSHLFFYRVLHLFK